MKLLNLLCFLTFLLQKIHANNNIQINLNTNDNNIHTNNNDKKNVHTENTRHIDTDLGLNENKEPITIWDPITQKERVIKGRFLHITDIHPDSLYQYGYSIDKSCHFPQANDNKGTFIKDNLKKILNWDKNSDRAPFFGKPMSQCDSPMELMSNTLNWIQANLKDKIDFIIWTGDNMRHDNDRYNPRTELLILDMNQLVSDTFYDKFVNDTDKANFIDIIPSLGNNDVFPHNLFALGPTLQTREFLKIWYPYVPQEQHKIFQRGLSFVKEIIPNKLAVISINSLYLFKANPLVDNCNSPKQPGYQLLTWLGLVLDEMRHRGMKVWLSGHVPPLLKNLDDSCYNKFTMWVKEYNDIIIGGVYGHMNVDHFVPVNGKKARKDLELSYSQNVDNKNNKLSKFDFDIDTDLEPMGAKPQNKEIYMQGVKDQYEEIFKRKSKKKVKDKDFAIVNVAGSVIPTFNPSFRIWEYNITNLQDEVLSITKDEHQDSWENFFNDLDKQLDEIFKNSMNVEDDSNLLKNRFSIDVLKNDRSIPRKKPKGLPLGPAYRPQLFSPERFIQYYLPLDEVNDKFEKLIAKGLDKESAIKESFQYEIEYTSNDEPYNLENLFVKDYLKLAKRLINDKKSWARYMKYSYISTDYKDEKMTNK